MDYLQILIDLHYNIILTINQTKNIIKRKEKGWASGWNGTRKSCELRNGKGTSRMSDLLFELVDEATNDKLQIYENRIKFTKKERTAAGCNVMTKTFPISALRSVQIRAPERGSAGFLQVSSGSGAVCGRWGLPVRFEMKIQFRWPKQTMKEQNRSRNTWRAGSRSEGGKAREFSDP